LDDQRIPKHLAIPVVGIGGIKSDSSLKSKLSTVGTDNRWTVTSKKLSAVQFIKRFCVCSLMPHVTCWQPQICRWRLSPDVSDFAMLNIYPMFFV
jgi:hypothetical protein